MHMIIKGQRKKSIISSIILGISLFTLTSCGEIDTKNIEDKANKIADFKVEDLKLSKESLAKLINEINLEKFGKYKIDLVQDNTGDGVKLNFESINTSMENKDLQSKLAIIFAALKDVDYIEIYDGTKTVRYDKNTIFKNININFDEINKSKDSLRDFVKKYVE